MNSLFGRFLNFFGVIFRTLRAYFLRQFISLVARIRRLGSASRYAAKAVPKVLSSVAVAGQKPTRRSDYIETKRLYIAKSLIVTILIIAIALFLIFFFIARPWLVSRFFTLRVWEQEEKVLTYSGKAALYWDKELRHLHILGRLKNGETAGSVKVYDEKGGLIYEGGFAGKQYNGQGKSYEGGVLLYEGEFLNMLYSGKGKLYNAAGALVYAGDFAAGQREGHGLEYYPKGGILYDGEFRRGLKSGAGKQYYPSGALRYTGSFAEDLYSGAGELFDEFGAALYSGGFLAGEYSGPGTLFHADGSPVYRGEFLSGEYDGTGKLYLQSNKLIEGRFSKGAISGKAELYDGDNLIYAGTFSGETPDGYGSIYEPISKKLLFTGYISDGKIDLTQFGRLSSAEVGELMEKAAYKETVKADFFIHEYANAGISVEFSFKTAESEPLVIAVSQKKESKLPEMFRQDKRLVFGAAGDTGGAADSSGSILKGGDGTIKTQTVSGLLSGRELDDAKKLSVFTALFDYAECAARVTSLLGQLKAKQAHAGRPNLIPEIAAALETDISNINKQLSIARLALEKPETALKYALADSSIELSRVDLGDLSFGIDKAPIKFEEALEALTGGASEEELSLQAIDAQMQYERLQIAESALTAAMDAFDKIVKANALGAVSDREYYAAYALLFTAKADFDLQRLAYSRSMFKYNGLTGGYIAQKYDWLRDFLDDFSYPKALNPEAPWEEETEEPAEAPDDDTADVTAERLKPFEVIGFGIINTKRGGEAA